MSIQTRLLKARYGEYNIHLPTNKELYNHLGRPPKYRIDSLKIKDISDDYINLFINPPKKDRYYKEHKKLMDDYIAENPSRSKTILTYDAIIRLAYFLANPDIYHNNFQVFAPSWISHTLFSMRKYIMKQRMRDGRLPTLYNFTSPSSGGYYKLPKPMLNKTNILIANKCYDLLESRAIRYLELAAK
jgi:hypothetical protein